MSTAALVERTQVDYAVLEKVVVGGDLAKLSAQERVAYYRQVCESLGLNPFTKPFDYLNLNGKLTLYATKNATDQIRDHHHVSVQIMAREQVDELYVVTVRATTPDGRTDESIGAVTIGGLKGDAKANALMKCETKAKRRATLSIKGLGFLDETEIETIPSARAVVVDDEGEIHEAAPRPIRAALTAREAPPPFDEPPIEDAPFHEPPPPAQRQTSSLPATRGGANTGKGFDTSALIKRLMESDYVGFEDLRPGMNIGQVIRYVQDLYGTEIPADRYDEQGRPKIFPSTIWEFVKAQEQQLPLGEQ